MPNRRRDDGSTSGHRFKRIHLSGGTHQLGDINYFGLDNPIGRLPYAVGARFNSYSTQREPECLPDTRIDLLSKIYSWGEQRHRERIFWLKGLAGTGKSTIARTIARRYFEQGCLGASFFFSRGGGDTSNSAKFVTSIAIQLADSIPALQRHICDAITERSDIASQTLHDQWQHLVLHPLSKLDGNGCKSLYLLVVDALDECDNDSDIRIIVQLLSKVRSLERVQLQVFLTSRPETPIRYGFCQIPNAEHQDFVLHDISPPIVDHDISIFLEYRLQHIREEHSLDASWPGAKVIGNLVQSASGLFIWAATACRFIHEGLFAEDRLRTLLDGDASTNTPEEHLNTIYVTILRNCLHPDYTTQEKRTLHDLLRRILGSAVALFSPLSVAALSRLLEVPRQRADRLLKDLHAILDLPNDEKLPLRLHHPSFRDFLLKEQRSGDFWVDAKQAHQTLGEGCIRLMANSLKQDICDVKAPGVLFSDVERVRVELCIPPDVQYACLYWIQHLQQSGGELHDDDQVHRFLRTHCLHWLEALGWMERMREGIAAIISLESLVLMSDSPRLRAFVCDLRKFTLHSQSAIETAPLQTYCSALIFAPSKSIIRKQFEDRIPTWMQRVPEVQDDWSPLVHSLDCYPSGASGVACSSDSKLVMSTLKDGSVRQWDAMTGAAMPLLDHRTSAYITAFSSDGKIIASGLADHTIRLWHITGAVTHELNGHSARVASMTFSPNNKVLASAADDKTVRLWDVVTGEAIRTLVYNSQRVHRKPVVFSSDGDVVALSGHQYARLWEVTTGAVLQDINTHCSHCTAFSTDCKEFASSSISDTINIWDTTTGQAIWTLSGYEGRILDMAFSPNGKILASASEDWDVKLWNLATGVAVHTLSGHMEEVYCVYFSSDSEMVASAAYDDTVRLWDTATGEAMQTFDHNPERVRAIAISPNCKLVASVSSDATVKLWNALGNTTTHTLDGPGPEDHVDDVVISPDRRLVALLLSNCDVMLYNTETSGATCLPDGYEFSILAFAFSPNSKVVAVAATDRTTRLLDATTGAIRHKRCSSQYSYMLAFSHSGQFVATVNLEGGVEIWDTITGEIVGTLDGFSGSIMAIAFSPNDEVVVAASSDRDIMLWDTTGGLAMQRFQSRMGRIDAITFSPDGTVVAGAADDGTIRLWNATTGAELQTLKVNSPFPDVTICAAPFESRSKKSILVTERWISLDAEGLLYLPSYYQPRCAAVSGSLVVLGHESGRVTTMELNLA